MKEIQQWARDGQYDLPIDISKCEIPICAACQFGEAKKKKPETGTIAKETKPGDFISVDAMEAGIPGYIPFTKGRPLHKQYSSKNLWSDHSSKISLV